MKLSRKEREQRFRADFVLEVAEGVFAKHGFRSTSVEEIATRAELSIGSLYNLFPSKEALFAAVVERRHDELLAGLKNELTGEASPLRQLERVTASTLSYFEQHEATFRLYLSSTNGFLWNIRPTLGEWSFEKHLEFLKFVAGICREGMAKEGWPRSDPESLALVIVGMLNAFLTRWVTIESGKPITPRVREAQVFMRRLVGVETAGSSNMPRPMSHRR